MRDSQYIEDVYDQIIRNAPYYHLKMDRDKPNKCLIIRDVHLSSDFSCDRCDIMFKYDEEGEITILFPEHIQVSGKPEPPVCPAFLSTSDIKGWKKVCRYISELSHGFLFVGIPVVLQFIKNPKLCGIQGCDGRICYEKLMAEQWDEIDISVENDGEYYLGTDSPQDIAP